MGLSAERLLSIVTFFRKDKHNFPWLVETTLSWLSATVLGGYLGLRYMISTQRWISQSKASILNVPLSTLERSQESNAEDGLIEFRKAVEAIRQNKMDSDFADEELLKLMRSSLETRQLASMAMRKLRSSAQDLGDEANAQLEQLKRIWAGLLVLPPQAETYPYEISLIVPAYGEKGSNIQSNLQRGLSSCQNASKVEVILVDAGRNTDLDTALQRSAGDKSWGDIKLVSYEGGGGRGPTLNHGAKHSSGRILTFLHSDNVLPENWDKDVARTFTPGDNRDAMTIACAFSFKIHSFKGGAPAPGIAAAQWLGTLRTRRFHTLYGDSVLSIPASTFDYIGGYPSQALMEDYEMMDLLRKRVAYFQEEHLCIHDSETLISARRWEQFGVTYVTLFNFLCVFLYENRGWSPQDLYNFYYQRRSSD